MMMSALVQKHTLLSYKLIEQISFQDVEQIWTRQQRHNIYYYNIPASYDLESSSFRDSMGKEVTLAYVHALNIDGYVFISRTWKEFKHMMEVLAEKARTTFNNRILIYVHNLSYDFQFIKKHFEFVSVFNNGDKRKILKALTNNGIEFRCSYMLTNSSLKNVARNLVKYKISKLEGDLDYNKIRTPLTNLTDKEWEYVLNDVLIIEYHLREAMEESGNIAKIPLTNTGYVRNYVRDKTIKGDDKASKRYRRMMRELTLEVDEYKALRAAFQGGFTHANAYNSGRTMSNVTAKDFASSYPGRMIAYRGYPMSKGELYEVKDKDEFFNVIESHCALFYVRFEGLVRNSNESYISVSKLISKKGVTANNGRVESAEYVELWMTEVDFAIVQMSYEIDDFKVGTLYRYRRGYLPTKFVEAVLDLYEDKTKLKGIEGRIADYNRSKGMLNSTFGMCVTDIAREEFQWNDLAKSVETVESSIEEQVEKNNKSRRRFLFYPWGVWITAYARYDLFKDIVKLGDDYIYADTDSVYFTNGDKNEHIFEESNREFIELLKLASKHHNIDFEKFSPKDSNGIPRTIGLWNDDGKYKRFKTLGAKRYMVEDYDGEVNITVSGVNKKEAVPYLKKTYGDKIFEHFDDKLHVPAGHSGKSTHTYIDDVKVGIVTDYLGQEYEYEELSGIHLEETSYSMTISNEYREFIDMLQGVKRGIKRA